VLRYLLVYQKDLKCQKYPERNGGVLEGAHMTAERRKSDSLRGQVYDSLRQGLKKGKVGARRITTERDLAEELGVSRTPVREALALLVHEGLVLSTSRGFSAPELSPRDIADLFQIRRLLEPAALAMTVEHLSLHVLRMLRQFLTDHEVADKAADVDAFVAANSNFRSTWLSAVPNTQLRRLVELNDDHVHWVRRLTLSDTRVRKKVVTGLRNMLSALEEGKPTVVAAAMLAHVDAAEAALTAVLNSTRGQRPAA
jgi:DNA-binding GntR family transcriptional regulator